MNELKIEAGKFYRRRDGVKQRVDVVWPDGSASGWDELSKNHYSWWPHGCVYQYTAACPRDLLSPWTEPDPPRLRAWKAEEVPTDHWFRDKGLKIAFQLLEVSRESWRSIARSGLGWDDLLAYYEHSGGPFAKDSEWKACGVLEEAK